MASEDDDLRVQQVHEVAEAAAEPPPELLERGERPLVAFFGTGNGVRDLRLGPEVHVVLERPGEVGDDCAQQRPQTDVRLEAPSRSAPAERAVRVDLHVAGLAREPRCSAHQAPVDHEPGADADLPDHVEEVARAGELTDSILSEGPERRLVVHRHRHRASERAAQQLDERDLTPAEVRREAKDVGRHVDDAGHRERDARKVHARRVDGVERLVDQRRKGLDDTMARCRGCVERALTFEESASGDIHREHRDVVDVQLGTDRDDLPAVELDQRRRATRARRGRRHETDVAHEPAILELGDEARHRHLVEAGVDRDRSPAARPFRVQQAQHEREVVPAHRRLVRGRRAVLMGSPDRPAFDHAVRRRSLGPACEKARRRSPPRAAPCR